MYSRNTSRSADAPMAEQASILTPPDTPAASQKANEADTPPATSSTAAILERLSSAIPTAINERDLDFTTPDAQELLSHISPRFQATMDTQPGPKPLTWIEQMAAWKERAAEYPDVKFEVVNVASHVDEKKGKARVYVDMEVFGLGEGVKLNAMNELKWRRERDDGVVDREGRWMLWSVLGMRGSPMDNGGFG